MTGLAGWLFADLLLVLFITAFASTTTPSAPPKPPRPAPSPAASHPAPKPSSSRQPVLILHPVSFTLRVPPGIVGSNGASPADLALVGELKSALRAKGLGNSRAGLVEAFGWSLSPDGDGTQVAKAANRAVTKNLALFAQATQQNFWQPGADGTVTLEVFFFAHTG